MWGPSAAAVQDPLVAMVVRGRSGAEAHLKQSLKRSPCNSRSFQRILMLWPRPVSAVRRSQEVPLKRRNSSSTRTNNRLGTTRARGRKAALASSSHVTGLPLCVAGEDDRQQSETGRVAHYVDGF